LEVEKFFQRFYPDKSGRNTTDFGADREVSPFVSTAFPAPPGRSEDGSKCGTGPFTELRRGKAQ